MTMLVMLLIPRRVIYLEIRYKSIDWSPPIQCICSKIHSSTFDIINDNLHHVVTLAIEHRDHLYECIGRSHCDELLLYSSI